MENPLWQQAALVIDAVQVPFGIWVTLQIIQLWKSIIALQKDIESIKERSKHEDDKSIRLFNKLEDVQQSVARIEGRLVSK